MSEDISIPKAMRLAMTFIDRVGFPIFAFLVMVVLYVVDQRRADRREEQYIEVMEGLKTQLVLFNVAATNGRH